MIFTKEFLKGAAERAVKTALQVFVAVLTAAAGADAVGLSAGLGSVNWLNAASVAALAAILSVATSVGNASFTAGQPAVEPVPERGEPDEADPVEDFTDMKLS